MSEEKTEIQKYPGIVAVEALLDNPEQIKQVWIILKRVQEELAGKEEELSTFITRALSIVEQGKGKLLSSDEKHIRVLRGLIDFPETKKLIFDPPDTRLDGFDVDDISKLWKDTHIWGENTDISYKAFLVASLLRHYQEEESVTWELEPVKDKILRVIEWGKQE